MGGGSPSPAPAPAQQTVNQTSEFPDELKPYISDILERAKTRTEARDAAGYQLYPGPRLAEFQPEQQEAQSGIAAMARNGIATTPYGSSRLYMPQAYAGTVRSAEQFTPQAASQYMSPYIQSVIDINKREAERQGDLQMQGIRDQAVGAGSFGGSRQAFLESEQNRNEAQLLNDIQTKGMQSAYEQAQSMFERQKARDLAAGSQFAGLAEQAPRLGIAEMGALSGVGQQKQEQAQRALDIGYQQFQEEQQYPEASLQQYSSIIRGFPLTPNQFGVTQTAAPAPNLVTQLAGAAATGAGIYGAFKAMGGRLVEGHVKRLETGGSVDEADEEEEEEDTTAPVIVAQPTPSKKANLATVKKKSAYEEELSSQLEDNKSLSQAIKDSAKSNKEALEAKKKSIQQDKYLALIQGGAEMMEAGGEGKNLLTGVGRGAKAALPAFAKARAEERDVSSQIAGVDLDAALKSYGMSKDRIDMLSAEEKLQILRDEAEARGVSAEAALESARARKIAAGNKNVIKWKEPDGKARESYLASAKKTLKNADLSTDQANIVSERAIDLMRKARNERGVDLGFDQALRAVIQHSTDLKKDGFFSFLD